MAMLSRNDQEAVVLSFEKDYGKIIMRGNELLSPDQAFVKKAHELELQIKQVAKDDCFEEDLLCCLFAMSESLEKVA